MTNHEHDHDLEQEESTVVLTDEDGNEHEFELLTILEVDEVSYAVLLPLLESEATDVETEDMEEEAIILRIGQDEDGNDILQEIEDDAEWDKVAAEYDKLVEEEEQQ